MPRQQGDGCGCGFVVLLVLIVLPWVMLGDALQGEASLWWIPVSILFIAGEILLVVGAIVGVVEHFSPGACTRLTKRSTPTQKSSRDQENYGLPLPEEDHEQIRRDLQYLGELRADGLITYEDFERKKKDILDRL